MTRGCASQKGSVITGMTIASTPPSSQCPRATLFISSSQTTSSSERPVSFRELLEVFVVPLCVLHRVDLLQDLIEARRDIDGEGATEALVGADLIDEVALCLGQGLEDDSTPRPAQKRLREGEREDPVDAEVRVAR